MDQEFLRQCPLFAGVCEDEAQQMLSCLRPETKRFDKGSVICHAGDPVKAMGLVLRGSVHVENIDLTGNKSILNRIGAGQVFGESYACIPGERMMVSVTAAEDVQIMFLDVGRVLKTCSNACPCHGRLMENLLRIMAKRNLELSRRSLHTAPKSIRGRLVSYLSQQAGIQGSPKFVIPFNRQELADYLEVDRSALSKELGRMRREGILEFHRNEFCLIQKL